MERIIGIDLLRALSILYIVGFWHLLNYTHAIPNYNNIITYRITWIILGTFVLISGYFLGRKHISRNTLFTFYKKRLLRIYPPYLTAILVFFVLGLSNGITAFKAILGVSMFVRPAPPTLWFITMLLFFYILTPVIVYLAEQGIIRYLCSYIILVCTLLGYEYFSKIVFHYYYLDIRIAVYLAPFMTGIYIARNNVILEKNKSILFVITIITFLISCYFNSEHMSKNLLLSIPVITVAPLLMFSVFKKLTFTSLAAQRIIIFLSSASYFMYLFHRAFYKIITKIYFPNTPVIQLLFLITICLPIIIIASFLMQNKYDNISNSLIGIGLPINEEPSHTTRHKDHAPRRFG